MIRGLFITFEGGEGAGKTTQIRRLAEKLPQAVMTREPGGTPEGDALRTVFIEQKGQDWPPRALLLLMFSARVLHTENFILPALAKGQTVLCDRFTDSTRVYQGYAGGLSLEDIESVKQAAIGPLEPDLTFILDIPPEDGLKRAAARSGGGDTFEAKDLAFHESLRQGYLSIARQAPQRCIVIDARQSEDDIARLILHHVEGRLV